MADSTQLIKARSAFREILVDLLHQLSEPAILGDPLSNVLAACIELTHDRDDPWRYEHFEEVVRRAIE